jgi:membrane associated rhomboid family serine protease
MTGLSSATGSVDSRRQIRLMGKVIGAAWLTASLPAILMGFEATLPYRLGGKGGSMLIQLMTYSMIHLSPFYLLFDLVWLAGVVQLAERRLAADAFVRLYSVGTIGGGLIFLGLEWLALTVVRAGPSQESIGLSGGFIALATMLGALSRVGDSSAEYLLGEAAARWVRGRFGPLAGAYGAALLGFHLFQTLRAGLPFGTAFSSFFEIWRLEDAGTFVALCIVLARQHRPWGVLTWFVVPELVALTIIYVVVLPSLADSRVWTWMIAVVAGLVVGMGYGSAERAFARHARAS